jgi:hypothetical protein
MRDDEIEDTRLLACEYDRPEYDAEWEAFLETADYWYDAKGDK